MPSVVLAAEYLLLFRTQDISGVEQSLASGSRSTCFDSSSIEFDADQRDHKRSADSLCGAVFE
jgi:hypothetical protein